MLEFIKNSIENNSFFKNGPIVSIAYIVLLFVMAKILVSLIRRFLKQIAIREKRENDMLFLLLRRLTSLVVYTIATILAFQEIVPLQNIGTALLGVSGVFTVVIAMGTQELAGNFVAGVVLSAYQPFSKGDMIHIIDNNISGTIEDLNMRHCTIRTLENSKIIVPNKILNGAVVENRSSTLSDPYCNHCFFDVSYDSDIKKARQILLEYLKKDERVLNKEELEVTVHELKESSVSLRVKVLTKTTGEGYALKVALNEYVLSAFVEAGIEIPYPYRTIIQKDAE